MRQANLGKEHRGCQLFYQNQVQAESGRFVNHLKILECLLLDTAEDRDRR